MLNERCDSKCCHHLRRLRRLVAIKATAPMENNSHVDGSGMGVKGGGAHALLAKSTKAVVVIVRRASFIRTPLSVKKTSVDVRPNN